MRELKFRAWNPEKQEMIMPNRGNYVIELDGVASFVDWGTLGFYPLPKIKIMQFTGLKDKNGKEIYEGDIVKSVIDEKVYEVFWYSEHLSFWGMDYSTDLVSKLALLGEEVEIIGNMYENPELLDKEGK